MEKITRGNHTNNYAETGRHIYAVIARGNYTRGVEFYADLVDTPSGNHEGAKHNHNAYIDPPPPDDESDVTVSDEPEVSTDSTDLWSEAIDSYGDPLSEIVEDLIGRLKQGTIICCQGLQNLSSLPGRWQTPQCGQVDGMVLT